MNADQPDAAAAPSAVAGGQAVQTVVPAAERLAENRERMRQWMLRLDGRYEARRRAAAAQAEGAEPSLIDRLRGHPVFGLLIDAITGWWDAHPLNATASLANGVVRETIGPLARRHPFLMVSAAVLAGALLMRFRFWRRLVKPALFAGLVSQIATRLIAQLPSIIDTLHSFTQRHEPEEEPLPSGAEPEAAAEMPLPAASPEEARAVPPVVQPARREEPVSP
jgi:hypothetical protein